MSIHDEHGERKAIGIVVKNVLKGRGYVVFLVLGTGIASFCLGYLSAKETDSSPVVFSIPSAPAFSGASPLPGLINASVANVYGVSPVIENQGPVIASKKGSVYYLPWCAYVRRIKPENRVTFNSEAEAQSAGYVRSTACFGSD